MANKNTTQINLKFGKEEIAKAKRLFYLLNEVKTNFRNLEEIKR